MKPDDKFLKVVMTAYFPVSGMEVEKRENANNPDLSGIYLDGKHVTPDLAYFVDVKDGEELDDTNILPVDLFYDSADWNEEIVTRDQVWEEFPEQRFIDEYVTEQNDKKAKTKTKAKTKSKATVKKTAKK